MKTQRIAFSGVFLFLLLTVVARSGVQAQVQVYYVQPVGVSIRGDSFADAYSADAFDVTSMYGNPASLSYLYNESVVVSDYITWAVKSHTISAATPVFLNQDFHFGIGASYESNGKVFQESGNGIPMKSYELDIAVSTRVIPTLSVGVLAGVRKFTFADLSRPSDWAQLGVFYNPLPGIAYGLVYRYRNGLAFVKAGDALSLVRYRYTPADLELGAAMTYPSNAVSPIVSLSLSTVKTFPSAERFNIKGGLEVYPVNFLALRLGYKVGSTTNVPRFGIGVHVRNFRCDFGIGPNQSDEQFHGFSLSYSF